MTGLVHAASSRALSHHDSLSAASHLCTNRSLLHQQKSEEYIWYTKNQIPCSIIYVSAINTGASSNKYVEERSVKGAHIANKSDAGLNDIFSMPETEIHAELKGI